MKLIRLPFLQKLFQLQRLECLKKQFEVQHRLRRSHMKLSHPIYVRLLFGFKFHPPQKKHRINRNKYKKKIKGKKKHIVNRFLDRLKRFFLIIHHIYMNMDDGAGGEGTTRVRVIEVVE